MNSFLRKCAFAFFITSSVLIFNISYAANDTPKFDCTLTDQLEADESPGDAKDTFASMTPEIYLVCVSDEVEKGQTVKGEWIAADTNNAAPANYKIADKSISVEKDLDNDQKFTAHFSLSKPNSGWPLGSYHVDVYVNDQLSQSIAFTVK